MDRFIMWVMAGNSSAATSLSCKDIQMKHAFKKHFFKSVNKHFLKGNMAFAKGFTTLN